MPLLSAVALAAVVSAAVVAVSLAGRRPDRRVAVLWQEVLFLWDMDEVTRARFKGLEATVHALETTVHALETTVGNLKANTQRELNSHHGWLVSLQDDARAAKRQIEPLSRLVDGQGDRLDRLELTATACADALGRFADPSGS